MSNFRTWSLTKLNKRFGLNRLRTMPEIEAWEKEAVFPLSDYDTYFLKNSQDLLADNVFTWNEEELAQNFIGPLFSWLKFSSKHANIFNERSFVGVVEGEELSGEPDAIIASGHDEPEKPYFCFHEYKKESPPLSPQIGGIKGGGDPAGQCLAAMLVAQEINEHKYPVFGIYVVGQNWYFVVLKGKDYTISPSFSAISDEIYPIYQRLLWLKQTILDWIQVELKIEN